MTIKGVGDDGAGWQVVPQAVLSPLTRAALFLVVTIDQAGESRVRDLLPELQRAVGFRSPESRLSCVTGIGARAWDPAALDQRRPPNARPPVATHQVAAAVPGDQAARADRSRNGDHERVPHGRARMRPEEGE